MRETQWLRLPGEKRQKHRLIFMMTDLLLSYFFLGEVDWYYLDSLAQTEPLKLIKGVRAENERNLQNKQHFRNLSP